MIELGPSGRTTAEQVPLKGEEVTMAGYHGKANVRLGAADVAFPVVVMIDHPERSDWTGILDRMPDLPTSDTARAAQVVLLESPHQGRTAQGELRSDVDRIPCLRGRSPFV
jgi:hypothetical protein